MDNKQWHRWFAWHPVRLTDKWAWWDYIERRWNPDTNFNVVHPDDRGDYDGAWEYRAIVHDYQLKVYDSKGRCYTEEQIAYLMHDSEVVEVIEILASKGVPEDHYFDPEEGLSDSGDYLWINYPDIRRARAVLARLKPANTPASAP